MVRRIVIVLLNICAISAAGSVTGCSYSGPSDLEQGGVMPDKTIEQVLKERTDEWMGIPGVEGTAIGLFEGRPCIRFLHPQNHSSYVTRYRQWSKAIL